MKAIIPALVALTLSATAAAQEGPGAGEVSIKDVKVNGSGCPVGTASVIVTNSQPQGPIDQAQIVFDEFVVNKPGDDRKFCNVAIDMKFPQGWSYTVDRMETPLVGDIAEGVTGRVEYEVSVRGTTAKSKVRRQQKGHWQGQADLVEYFDAPAWSPCGKVLPMNVKTTLGLSGKAKTGDASVLAVRPETHFFRVRWKRC